MAAAVLLACAFASSHRCGMRGPWLLRLGAGIPGSMGHRQRLITLGLWLVGAEQSRSNDQLVKDAAARRERANDIRDAAEAEKDRERQPQALCFLG